MYIYMCMNKTCETELRVCVEWEINLRMRMQVNSRVAVCMHVLTVRSVPVYSANNNKFKLRLVKMQIPEKYNDLYDYLFKL